MIKLIVVFGLLLAPFSYFQVHAQGQEPEKVTVLVPETDAELRQATQEVANLLEREHEKNPDAKIQVGFEMVAETGAPISVEASLDPDPVKRVLPIGTRIKMGLIQFTLNGTGIYLGMKFHQGVDFWQAAQVALPLGFFSGVLVVWGEQYFKFISRPKSELAKRAFWWSVEVLFLSVGIGLKALGGVELAAWHSILAFDIALSATMGMLGQGGAELSIAQRMFDALKRDPANGRTIRFKAQVQRVLASAISTTLTVAFPNSLIVMLGLGGAGETIRQVTLRKIRRLRCADSLRP